MFITGTAFADVSGGARSEADESFASANTSFVSANTSFSSSDRNTSFASEKTLTAGSEEQPQLVLDDSDDEIAFKVVEDQRKVVQHELTVSEAGIPEQQVTTNADISKEVVATGESNVSEASRPQKEDESVTSDSFKAEENVKEPQAESSSSIPLEATNELVNAKDDCKDDDATPTKENVHNLTTTVVSNEEVQLESSKDVQDRNLSANISTAENSFLDASDSSFSQYQKFFDSSKVVDVTRDLDKIDDDAVLELEAMLLSPANVSSAQLNLTSGLNLTAELRDVSILKPTPKEEYVRNVQDDQSLFEDVAENGEMQLTTFVINRLETDPLDAKEPSASDDVLPSERGDQQNGATSDKVDKISPAREPKVLSPPGSVSRNATTIAGTTFNAEIENMPMTPQDNITKIDEELEQRIESSPTKVAMGSVISSVEVVSTGVTQLVEKNVNNPADATFETATKILVDPSLSIMEAGVATELEQPEIGAQPESKGEICEVEEPEEVEKQNDKSFPSGHIIEPVEDDIPKAADATFDELTSLLSGVKIEDVATNETTSIKPEAVAIAPVEDLAGSDQHPNEPNVSQCLKSQITDDVTPIMVKSAYTEQEKGLSVNQGNNTQENDSENTTQTFEAPAGASPVDDIPTSQAKVVPSGPPASQIASVEDLAGSEQLPKEPVLLQYLESETARDGTPSMLEGADTEQEKSLSGPLHSKTFEMAAGQSSIDEIPISSAGAVANVPLASEIESVEDLTGTEQLPNEPVLLQCLESAIDVNPSMVESADTEKSITDHLQFEEVNQANKFQENESEISKQSFEVAAVASSFGEIPISQAEAVASVTPASEVEPAEYRKGSDQLPKDSIVSQCLESETIKANTPQMVVGAETGQEEKLLVPLQSEEVNQGNNVKENDKNKQTLGMPIDPNQTRQTEVHQLNDQNETFELDNLPKVDENLTDNPNEKILKAEETFSVRNEAPNKGIEESIDRDQNPIEKEAISSVKDVQCEPLTSCLKDSPDKSSTELSGDIPVVPVTEDTFNQTVVCKNASQQVDQPICQNSSSNQVCELARTEEPEIPSEAGLKTPIILGSEVGHLHHEKADDHAGEEESLPDLEFASDSTFVAAAAASSLASVQPSEKTKQITFDIPEKSPVADQDNTLQEGADSVLDSTFTPERQHPKVILETVF